MGLTERAPRRIGARTLAMVVAALLSATGGATSSAAEETAHGDLMVRVWGSGRTCVREQERSGVRPQKNMSFLVEIVQVEKCCALCKCTTAPWDGHGRKKLRQYDMFPRGRVEGYPTSAMVSYVEERVKHENQASST